MAQTTTAQAISLPNFDQWRGITARFATPAEKTACGHAIEAGAAIGWTPRGRHVLCPTCWANWRREVAAEILRETTGSDCGGDF